MNKYENLIKIMEEIECDNTIIVSRHGYCHRPYPFGETYFEYEKTYEVECIYHNGDTWVIRIDNKTEFELDEYGKTWKLTDDSEIDYESLELTYLTEKDFDEIFGY